MSLNARPVTRDQARDLIREHHRHLKNFPGGYRYAIAAYEDDRYCGVVVVGRPVARKTDQYAVAEVTRLCTDGTKNACSFLYARAARAAEAMGFDSIQTFILKSEPGTSLRAAGWVEVSRPPGQGGWNSRPGRTLRALSEKTKWVKHLGTRGC